MIDKDSPIPIYYQLEELIRTQIENEALQPGDLIPSERELAEQYHISRMTVRQAITNLVNEGLLVRKKGKGTFVAERKIEQPLSKLRGFSEDMRSLGMVPETKLLEFKEVPAPIKVSRELHIKRGDLVYQISRLRLADGRPMACEVAYLSKQRIHGLTEETVKGSLYQYIEQELKLKIERAIQSLEPSVAFKQESQLLEIAEQAPVLLMRRTTYLSDGTPFEYVKSVYRGDRYKFVIEMYR
ncbi:GntR family transcriptional regulator [Caldalkalibacillus uzonensis]|uniref:GntR family transcriptional regulator n=1 Tax=Caldalkalibacillus uzonensis TaxID=353224 RepID=A0ABU0CSG8_9BACI|nr:GntR family transcriptional regulator [Caldalkalibacillus uzonensis]MDQ0339335.1 GntR family transcriptional regulator [Caldalkalibacillus uzonensis]